MAKLRKGHIRLKYELDVLTWAINPAGEICTVKLGYLTLQNAKVDNEAWWRSKIWKMKAPSKCTLFMWLVLCNKTFQLSMF